MTGRIGQHAKHAVYVQKWNKVSKGKSVGYKFECLNSWGETDANPKLTEKDISETFYISLSKGNTIY